MRTARSHSILGLVVFLFSAGMAGAQPDAYPTASIQDSSLMETMSGCNRVEAELKSRAIAQMEAVVDRNMAMALQGASCWPMATMDKAGPGRVTMESRAMAEGGTQSGPAAREVSTTNVQVAGVDEADQVKNDNRFIYLLTGNALLIVRAWPPENTRPVSSTPLEGEPKQMLVQGDRAVVFSVQSSPARILTEAPSAQTLITVLDITNRAAPRLERSIRLTGNYLTSRSTGGMVHAVVHLDQDINRRIQYWPPSMPWCSRMPVDPLAIRAAFTQLKQQNRQIIMSIPITELLPSATDLVVKPDGITSPNPSPFATCSNFVAPSTSITGGFLMVASFPVDQVDKPMGATTLLGGKGVVYASAENLYVATPEVDLAWGWWRHVNENTVIHKFQLASKEASSRYRASARLAGRLVNQFAMDEYQGFLRVALTRGRLPDPTTTNSVVVLHEPEAGSITQPFGAWSGGLVQVGVVDGIARGEDIRSVRFDGPRGFMVTFKKTDPLFVLDLSVPWSPRIRSELHIPGFSTYLHFMDDNHLLTIGYDAADQGDFAWFTGILLQVFDVSKMDSPQLMHKTVIGTRGSTSDATADHLAFNYFKQRNMLAIPLGICEGGNELGGYGSVMTFNGLRVYRVTVEEGFQLVGDVDHRDGSNQPGGCYHWWENPDSQVKRSVFMEDFVYSISNRWLKVNSLKDMRNPLASIPLPG